MTMSSMWKSVVYFSKMFFGLDQELEFTDDVYNINEDISVNEQTNVHEEENSSRSKID